MKPVRLFQLFVFIHIRALFLGPGNHFYIPPVVFMFGALIPLQALDCCQLCTEALVAEQEFARNKC